MDAANTTGPTGLELVLGSAEIEAKFRDGKTEQVKVRSLPLKLIQRWGSLQGDEASLVEMYCGKLDATALFKERNLASQEAWLMQQLGKTEDVDEQAKLRERLDQVQAQILDLESRERWDDKLTPESHDEIFALGERINRPRYERWTENTRESAAQMREQLKKVAMLNGSSSNGSSPSSASEPAAAERS